LELERGSAGRDTVRIQLIETDYSHGRTFDLGARAS